MTQQFIAKYKKCFFMVALAVSIVISASLLTVHVSVKGSSYTWTFAKMNKPEIFESDKGGSRTVDNNDSSKKMEGLNGSRRGDLHPPPFTAAAGDREALEMVWSRGSWGRFDTDSSPSLSEGSGGICSVYPSVSSLAVSCRGLTVLHNMGNPSVFPLRFTVEHQEGLYVHDVACSEGCLTAILESAANSMRNTVIIKSFKALSDECRRSDVCILMFDFLVSPTGRNKKISGLPPVCFLSVGDWGSTPGVIPIANAMNKVAKISFSKFIISTGDNFYGRGVQNTTDPQWVNTFEKPFSGPYVRNVRWYISLGNHDNWGVKSAQIEYGVTHPRWYLPSDVYSDLIPLFDSRKVSPLGRDNSNTLNATVSLFSSIHITTLDSFGDDLSKQMTFLKESLKQAHTLVKYINASVSGFVSSVWRVVLNHGPLFSGSLHGQDKRETDPLRLLLKPLIDKFKPHIYLGGHDHVLEVLHSGNTDYFVSGAGGGSRMTISKRIRETVWHQKKESRSVLSSVNAWLKSRLGTSQTTGDIKKLPKAENEEKLIGFMKHCVYFGDSDGVNRGNARQRIVTSLIKVDKETNEAGVLYDHTTWYHSSGSKGQRGVSTE
eukprot:Tbor_TRINITY_DN5201_c0_g1::TRINITY_DN5201_c0_g1_i2::g.16269::m.16269/K14379/ACP5; tartrate-resistant acid phosphatase type 5